MKVIHKNKNDSFLPLLEVSLSRVCRWTCSISGEIKYYWKNTKDTYVCLNNHSGISNPFVIDECCSDYVELLPEDTELTLVV